MINVNLSLPNPWAKENFKNLFNISGMISTNKAWEFEVIRYAPVLVDLSFRWSFHADHAGPALSLGLFGYSINVQIYDTRHWDYEANDWKI